MNGWNMPTVGAFAQDAYFSRPPQKHRGPEPEVIPSTRSKRVGRYIPSGNPPGRPRMSVQLAHEMRDYRNAGHTWSEVGERFNVDRSWARVVVARECPDVVKRPYRKRKHIDIAYIRELMAYGCTLRDVAAIVGLNHCNVWQRLQEVEAGCYFTEMGDKAREAIANSLSTGCEAAANSLLSCESTGK